MAAKQAGALRWVDPGTSRVVITNAKRRKPWKAEQLAHDEIGLHRFSIIVPGNLPVAFVATDDGPRFFAREAGDDLACVAAARSVESSAFVEKLSFDVGVGGKVAVFPGGTDGAALGPVLATLPLHGLHRVSMSGPVAAHGARLAWVIRFVHW